MKRDCVSDRCQYRRRLDRVRGKASISQFFLVAARESRLSMERAEQDYLSYRRTMNSLPAQLPEYVKRAIRLRIRKRLRTEAKSSFSKLLRRYHHLETRV